MALALVAGISFGALSVDFDRLDGDPAFEKAVEIIKKYENLHKASNWPYIGYGHRVLPGEGYRKGVVLDKAEAEALLRKDLQKYIRTFSRYGDRAILLGVLAYNIGPNAVKKSKVLSLINESSVSALRSAYLTHCRYRGKEHPQIRQRRIEEFDTLYEMVSANS